MKKCAACGNSNYNNARFCTSCGVILENREGKKAPAADGSTTADLLAKPESAAVRKKRLKTGAEGSAAPQRSPGFTAYQPFIIAALILVIALCGYAIYRQARPASGPGSTDPSPGSSAAISAANPYVSKTGQDTSDQNTGQSGSTQGEQEKIVAGDRSGYSKYINYTFGYSIDYPDDYRMNGSDVQSRDFTSPDGASVIEVYARPVSGSITIQSSYAEAMNSIPGASSNYHVLSAADEWYVVTGVDSTHRNIYRKTYLGNGFEKSFVITRPVDAAHPDYDQVIEDVEDSYQPHL